MRLEFSVNKCRHSKRIIFLCVKKKLTKEEGVALLRSGRDNWRAVIAFTVSRQDYLRIQTDYRKSEAQNMSQFIRDLLGLSEPNPPTVKKIDHLRWKRLEEEPTAPINSTSYLAKEREKMDGEEKDEK